MGLKGRIWLQPINRFEPEKMFNAEINRLETIESRNELDVHDNTKKKALFYPRRIVCDLHTARSVKEKL